MADAARIRELVAKVIWMAVEDKPQADIEAELTRFAAEVERGGWVSVEERLPDKTGQYLVCKVDGLTGVFITTFFAEPGMRAFHFADITHWRELPASPAKV